MTTKQFELSRISLKRIMTSIFKSLITNACSSIFSTLHFHHLPRRKKSLRLCLSCVDVQKKKEQQTRLEVNHLWIYLWINNLLMLERNEKINKKNSLRANVVRTPFPSACDLQQLLSWNVDNWWYKAIARDCFCMPFSSAWSGSFSAEARTPPSAMLRPILCSMKCVNSSDYYAISMFSLLPFCHYHARPQIPHHLTQN